MKKLFIASLTIFCATLFTFCATIFTRAKADTVENTNYEISSAEDLRDFAELVNSGTGEINAVLTENIDLSGICHPASDDVEEVDWTPIGTNGFPFTGVFDGQGHTITGLYINSTTEFNALFGVVSGGIDRKAAIKNLGVSGNVTSGAYAGGIIAKAENADSLLIEGCHSNVTVTSTGANAAGIVGVCMGDSATLTIKNCFNTGNISGGKESAAISGWLGKNALCMNVYNTGLVSGFEDDKHIFARFNSATFMNCATIEGTQDNVGSFDETLSNGMLAISLGEYWGQDLGADATPSIGGKKLYAIYDGDDCRAVSCTNEVQSEPRPSHTESFYDGDTCARCGEYLPDSMLAMGIDVSDATEDIIKNTFSWSNADRILTLNNVSILTAAEYAIKLPADSTIMLAEGSKNYITTINYLTTAIYCPGSLLITGEGSINASTMGGDIILVDAPNEDVVFSVLDTTFTGSGGRIYMPITNRTSRLLVQNSTFDIGGTSDVLVCGTTDVTLDATSEINIKNSSFVSGPLTLDANTQNGKAILSITDNSYVAATFWNGDIRGSGLNINAWDTDVDIHDSDLKFWTKGHNWGGNSHAFRINGKHDLSLNISRSNILLYAMSQGFWVDTLHKVSDDSSIENCTIINYSKADETSLYIHELDTTGRENVPDGYGDADAAPRVVKDNVMLICSKMQNSSATPSVTMEITGSPVVYRDFILPDSLGRDNEIVDNFAGYTMQEDQTITIVDGAKIVFTENAPLIMNKGCTIVGDFEGRIEVPDGEVSVTFDYGIGKSTSAYESGITLESPQSPHMLVPNYSFAGYYADMNFSTPYDFGNAINDSVYIYAKFSNSVNYELNDESGDSSTIEYVFGKDDASAAVVSTFRAGYQFAGWNTSENGDGTTVLTGDALPFDGTSITLYAQWTPTEAAFVVDDIPSVTYNGTAHTPELFASFVEDGESYDGINVISYADNVNAGTATVTYTLGNDPKVYTASFVINKAVYDMSGVTFADKTVLYTGLAQMPIISGELPSGVSVNYSANYVEPGSYTVTATFVGDYDNYQEIAPMTCRFVIEKPASAEPADSVIIILVIVALVLAILLCVRLVKLKSMRLHSVAPLFLLLSLPGGKTLWVIILSVLVAALLISNYVVTIKISKRKRAFLKNAEKAVPDEKQTSVANAMPEQSPAIVRAQLAATTSEAVTVVEEKTPVQAAAHTLPKRTVLVTYKRSFLSKLIQGGELLQTRYGILKNALLSYKKTRARVSWTNDTIRAGRTTVAKLAIRGKTLAVYLALDVNGYGGSQIGFEQASGKRYAALPVMIRITSDRKVKRALEAIAATCEGLGLNAGEVKSTSYAMPYETDEQLISRGLIKILSSENADGAALQKANVADIIRGQITVEEAKNIISDKLAASLITTKRTASADTSKIKLKKHIVNVDVLSQSFDDGDRVTLESLKSKGLIPRSANFVKVLARGILNKSLTVELHDFSIDAVKMILLTGGSVVLV